MAHDESPTYVYRLASVAGLLLYVGVADDVGRRFHQHAKQKEWWPEVVHVDLERFPTRHEALTAERRAILTEKPLHNIAHNADNDGRDGAVRWFCKVCETEILTGGQIVGEMGRARDHLRTYLTGTPLWQCSEWGFFEPYHDHCVPYNLDAVEPDGKRSFIPWEIDGLRSRATVLLWAVGLMQFSEIGGTYAAFLIERALGLAEVDV